MAKKYLLVDVDGVLLLNKGLLKNSEKKPKN